ncbi:MAG: formylglycine-generating enzyme family protein [Kiritimatiellae bacterium]|nr:formylglycine-generating enzyme family protein [Kiritimatiellia bacterium]
MNTKYAWLAALSACAAAVRAGVPSIPAESIQVAQDPATREVTVAYRLGAEGAEASPAIVTVDFETNVTGTAEGPWASIGARNFRRLGGDVNRLVQPGERIVRWRPDHTWPNNVVTPGCFRVNFKVWLKDDPPDYLAVNIAVPGESGRRYYVSEEALPGGIENADWCTDWLLMRHIRAAGVRWRMGSPADETGRENNDNAKPENLRVVTLTRDYFFGVFPLTQGQWNRVMGNMTNPTNDCQAKCDVSYEMIRYASNGGTAPGGGTWPVNKALAENSFMQKLRNGTGIDTFDLPTSAQWEYACRAGTTSALYSGKEITVGNGVDPAVEELAWYVKNASCLPLRVGMKKPNAWGIYDLYGSTYEWMLDWAEPIMEMAQVTDPIGPETGTKRLTSGSAWNMPAYSCRSARRGQFAPNFYYPGVGIFGLRVACDVPLSEEAGQETGDGDE